MGADIKALSGIGRNPITAGTMLSTSLEFLTISLRLWLRGESDPLMFSKNFFPLKKFLALLLKQ